jgi:hypothetical protein
VEDLNGKLKTEEAKRREVENKVKVMQSDASKTKATESKSSTVSVVDKFPLNQNVKRIKISREKQSRKIYGQQLKRQVVNVTVIAVIALLSIVL